jgi:hypothetical protein
MGYYLADGIYLKWVTFVKIIGLVENRADVEFAQEVAQKDIKRVFSFETKQP